MASLWTAPENLILASGSKIRSSILAKSGIPHTVVASNVDEREVEESISPKSGDYIAAKLARAKAQDVSMKMPGRFVLGVDQTLTLDGELLHKLGDMDKARSQLLRLRGQVHRLHCAIALVDQGATVFEYSEVAELKMRNFSEEFLDEYLACTGETILTSVGCYQIEGIGTQLFERISGDQFTVMGLPLLPLLQYLRRSGLLLS